MSDFYSSEIELVSVEAEIAVKKLCLRSTRYFKHRSVSTHATDTVEILNSDELRDLAKGLVDIANFLDKRADA